MRLKQVTLRHYRLHRDTKVEFDPKLQLIGGRNESGKSTIVEAIHRCLFLNAKGQTSHHALMEPRDGAGTPEVELLFENNGRDYRIFKKFAGLKGVVEFDEVGVSRLTGDSANEAIGKLLNAESGISGKTMAASWAHLWIEQGQSFIDPTDGSKLPAEQLDARLRTLGGTALSSSDLDAALAKKFNEIRGKIFKNNNDDFKDGSDAGKAESAMEEAGQRFAAAKARLEEIRKAIDGLEQATRETAESKTLLIAQEAEADKLRVQQIDFTRLDTALKGESAEVENALAKLRDLERATTDIAEARKQLAKAEKDALPGKQDVAQAETIQWEAAAAYESAKNALIAARKNLEIARIIEDLGALHLEKLGSELARAGAQAAAKEIEKLRSQLAALPDLTDKEFKALQKADKEAATSRLALEAQSARVKLVSGPQGIKVGATELKVGEDLLIAQPTLISTQDGSQIQLSPGGDDLSKLQKQAEEAQTGLAELLLKHRLGSFTEAEKLRDDRHRIQQTLEIKEQNSGTDGKEAGATTPQSIELQISSQESNLGRLGGTLPTFGPDPATHSRELADLKKATKSARDEVGRLESLAEATETARDNADQSLKRAKDSRATAEKTISELRIKLGLLESAYPDPAALTAAIDAQTKSVALASLKLQGTKESLASLPPNIGMEISRLERAISVTRAKQATAEKDAVQYAVQSRANGVSDPNEQFELLRAEHERAQQVFRGAADQANAIKMLADAYKAATQELDDHYTQPLLERVGIYLGSMFEAGARLEIKKTEEGFSNPTLIRPNSLDPHPTPFASLSGGAKEQVATAIRLATAEILAENYGGALPIVFDDAFAFTDRLRIQQVIRMLDLAANRGLQVILLSCTPEDYANLGAQEHLIK